MFLNQILILIIFEKSERAIRSFALFLKERKSNLLFLRTFAIFEKSERAIHSFALF